MLSEEKYIEAVNKLNYLFVPFEESKDRIWWVLCFAPVPHLKFLQCWFEAKSPENGNTYTYYTDLSGSLVGESDGNYEEALDDLLQNLNKKYNEKRKPVLSLVTEHAIF
jgi:hypothetical protein